MIIAKRQDWKTEPMPSMFTTISVEKLYSQEEFDGIAAGLIPKEMEDKWFIFYEEPWLYLHRSWTGYCIYKVRFESVAEGVKISEVQVNRDPTQYTELDDKLSAAVLEILLDSQAKRDVTSLLDYIQDK